jgi:hypothetical protein
VKQKHLEDRARTARICPAWRGGRHFPEAECLPLLRNSLKLVVCLHPDVVKSLETQELIHKAKSDNTDLFRNFADSIGAIPLTCDVHGSGDECPVDFIISCCRI